MAASEDLINFDLIETQKENIQSLPQGRSAKALATALGPSPFSPIATVGSTRSLNDAIRADYEKELEIIGESDDPLDVYDRYVKWTLNAYPSAQATPESQLRPLLERATKAFQTASHYKNDPRYLKLWLSYIRFFSDAPRETFAYLSRHAIGEGLALFYEEFAAWLEQADRWTQAEEVYKLGIEREARPTERLLRKFGEFQQRFERRPSNSDGPSSPALPTVRPALAAKVDPFDSSNPRPSDPQAQRLPSQGTTARSNKSKFAIFSDGGAPAPRPSSGDSGRGWQDLGTIAERKKENVMGAKPWVGETLKAGKKTSTGLKMMVYKDQSLSHNHESTNGVYASRSTTNSKTGRIEHVFVNLEAVYPDPENLKEEYSFDELRAGSRGWLDKKWTPTKPTQPKVRRSEDSTTTNLDSQTDMTLDMTTTDMTTCDITLGGTRKTRKDRASRPRRRKVMEVKGETQKVKANLDSPTSRKLRRKTSSTAEPTMTLHTKAANEEILDIFNQPLSKIGQLGTADEDSGDEDDYDTDDYTSGGDSTTGRVSGATSEYGDDEDISVRSSSGVDQQSISEIKSVSPWSDFTKSKHMPAIIDNENDTQQTSAGDDTRLTSGTGDETQRTTATDNTQLTSSLSISQEAISQRQDAIPADEEGLVTPVEGPVTEHRQTFIPIPPEDFEVPTNPYRDPAQVMQSRLPFMTPIVEKTESSLPSVKPGEDYFNAKTPCRRPQYADEDFPEIDGLLLDSPAKEETDEDTVSRPAKAKSRPSTETAEDEIEIKAIFVPETAIAPAAAAAEILLTQPTTAPTSQSSEPIIKDLQCNPVDESIRAAILAHAAPVLNSIGTYHDHRPVEFNKNSELRKFVKASSKPSKTSTDKAAGTCSAPILSFPESELAEYTIKRELGKGAFAPVYLASTKQPASDASAIETLVAIKAEAPPTPWEFHMMSLAHMRLSSSRASFSLARPLAMHLFADEGYLLETYHDQGTLLDLSNLSREEAHATGGPPLVDEAVAMFFAVEMLRTVEGLHGAGILHGDIKADNCLVRLAALPDAQASVLREGPACWSPVYSVDGSDGWAAKGVTLIDFGRAADMQAFTPGVRFLADWKTDRHDCPEMREGRPWSYHADYWGVAGVLHVLLFGKWLEDVVDSRAAVEPEADGQLEPVAQAPSLASGKRHRLREPLRRYWQTDLWARLFDALMNPGPDVPATADLAAVRAGFELYLVENAERRGLKAALKRIEDRIRDRRR